MATEKHVFWFPLFSGLFSSNEGHQRPVAERKSPIAVAMGHHFGKAWAQVNRDPDDPSLPCGGLAMYVALLAGKIDRDGAIDVPRGSQVRGR